MAEPLEFVDVERGGMFDSLGMEKPPSVLRKFVEFMFYFIMVLSTFPYLIGLGRIRYLLGALFMLTGLLSFLILKAEGERLPASIWFAIIINIGVNISEVTVQGELPIIGRHTVGHFHWLSSLIMVCYLAKNSAAAKRILFFYGMLVIVTVWLGGTEYVRAGRLELKEVTFGGSFSNANQLGCLAGFLASKYAKHSKNN